MTTSPLLGIQLIADNQSYKETTINDALLRLEQANNSSLAVNMASGNVTITANDFQTHMALVVSGLTANRTMTVPNTARWFAVKNLSSYPLTVHASGGSSDIVLAGTSSGLLQCDGAGSILLIASATIYRDFEMVVAISDEVTAIVSTGTAKVTFRMPHAVILTAVRASLKVAQTSGSLVTVDIKNAGSSVLSTLITLDNTEKTSVTAATFSVISSAAIADDAEMTIDITQIGDGTAKGLKVALIGYRT